MTFTPTSWSDLPSTSTPITAAQLNRIEAGIVSALQQGLAVVTDVSFAGGADKTGVADAQPAFAAAIAAVTTRGGTVYVPPGVYKLSSAVAVPSGVRIVGAGVATGGSTLSSQINVAIVGSTAAFNCTAGYSRLDGLAIISSAGTFTGYLVDYTGASLTEMTQCYLQATSSASLVLLKNAIHHRASKCNFVNGDVGHMGRLVSGDFSNAHLFDECRWGGQATASIKNAGQAWRIVGGASEPGAAGIANFYRHDAGVRAANLSIVGMWFGDITATGPNTTILWSGDNLAIRDSYCGWNDGSFVKIDENSCNGIVLDNNQYNAFNTNNPTYAVDFGSTTGHTGFQYTNKKVFTALTSELNGTLPTDSCLTLRPSVLDFGYTSDPLTSSFSLSTITANRTVYLRYRGAGPITKVGLHIGTQSGNIAVAAYRNTGVGRAARPGTRLGTSGSVACPVAGYAEVSLGGTIDIRDGDWLAVSADNAVATFANGGSTAGTSSSLARGLSHFENAYPPPATATPSATDAMYSYLLIGVP